MKTHEAESRRWYLQAADDAAFAEWVLREGRFFDKGCFICQQSGEKALKARLYAEGKRQVLGHSLIELATELLAVSRAFEEIVEQARRLDRYYIPTRYPNGLPGGIPFQSYSAGDLTNSIQDLREVFRICGAFLGEKGIDTGSPGAAAPGTR